ncbi:MAG: hypothetical protein RLZZ59_97 [Pseudomonadota bacterium]
MSRDSENNTPVKDIVEVTEVTQEAPRHDDQQEGKVRDFFEHAGAKIVHGLEIVGSKIVHTLAEILHALEPKVQAIFAEFLHDLATGKSLKDAGKEALEDTKKITADQVTDTIKSEIGKSDLDAQVKESLNTIVDNQRHQLLGHEFTQADAINLAGKVITANLEISSSDQVDDQEVEHVAAALAVSDLGDSSLGVSNLAPLNTDSSLSGDNIDHN